MDGRTAFEAIGRRVAPPRFVLFVVLLIVGTVIGEDVLGWREGGLAGFDLAAIAFIIACMPLFNNSAEDMRAAAAANDANRAVLLAITGAVMMVVLAAVAAELKAKQAPDRWSIVLVVSTLILAWVFSNLVYALHYAHMFYSRHHGKDCGGIDFPENSEPNYWDFLYFSFTLGMTFQTSDVAINDTRTRRVVTFHCLAAFVFNLGVLAFTINVLGGG